MDRPEVVSPQDWQVANLLDLTPFGRQEAWEDSPSGWPQTPTMQWLRLHDEYVQGAL